MITTSMHPIAALRVISAFGNNVKGGNVMPKVRIIFTFIILISVIPNVCMAVEYICIYGVTLHLNNNKKLDGYIETGYELYTCNEKEGSSSDKITMESFLETQKKYNNTITFINKLFCVDFKQYYEKKYRNISSLLVTESSYQTIKATDIKSMKSVCRKGNGHCSIWNISRITDHMAQYISSNKLVAGYYYYDNTPPQPDEGINDCHITLLSYNPKYTRKELIKFKNKIRKMSDKVLEKEKIFVITECAD